MFPILAHSYAISDLAGDAGAYWGGNAHGYGDVIGGSTYDINGAEVTLDNGILNIKIWTNFAGHAGEDSWAGPNGIGYGDVFLAPSWNPFGSDAHHAGGTFKLYELNGGANSENVLVPGDFLTCGLGTQCYYRAGQATAVDTASASVVDTGVTGSWTVTPGSMLEFTLNTNGTQFASYADMALHMALHWGETCQNDVIEGFGMIVVPGDSNVIGVPEPSTLALLGFGLISFGAAHRRRPGILGRSGSRFWRV